MHSQPIFFGEADYERWLSSALEAERRRLHLQLAPRPAPSHAQPPVPLNKSTHARIEGDTE
jgi:hypothetical protein